MIEPTADEAKNGWTAEKLTAYHAERNRTLAERMGLVPAQYRAWGTRPEGQRNRPTRAVSGYSPHKW